MRRVEATRATRARRKVAQLSSPSRLPGAGKFPQRLPACLSLGVSASTSFGFGRRFRPLNHLYAIALRIVLNFVHDVVDEQDAASG